MYHVSQEQIAEFLEISLEKVNEVIFRKTLQA